MSRNHGDGPIDRIALADASQINADAFPIKRDRLALGVKLEVLPAGAGLCFRQNRRVRHASGALDKSPGLREWTRRDVISAFGLLAEINRGFEQVEKARFDFDRVDVGGRVQPAHLRIVAVDGELGFEHASIKSSARHARSTAAGCSRASAPRNTSPSRVAKRLPDRRVLARDCRRRHRPYWRQRGDASAEGRGD